ncbi:MAG: exo-alpha-sialidase [Verrucomicrobia bacterium]|nr:exo-alpha-sialidase [Verrucomicrobiota bacterium]
MNSCPHSSSRRAFLKSSLALGAGLALSPFARLHAASGGEFKLLDTKTISVESQFYHGWPTVSRRDNGELWVVWSGGRDAHICPMGQVHAMTSLDNGETWSWPRVLLDSAIDDRDAGMLVTAKGTLLVSTFTSLAYEPFLEKAMAGKKTPFVNAANLPKWLGVHNRLSAEERRAQLGEWILRSTDAGMTWSTVLPSIVNSPHGPIQLKDGRLLYPGKQLWTPEGKIGVSESLDDGLTWHWLAEIPTREGDVLKGEYHELHGVETNDGRIIVHIRKEKGANANETLQTESSDGGKTWSVPHSIEVWGLPSQLLKLRDGRLLMSYGYRRKPFGNQVRVSVDNGKTWGEPLTISEDGAYGDLGYPSTVELADGTLLTVWYEHLANNDKAVLRQARWTLR